MMHRLAYVGQKVSGRREERKCLHKVEHDTLGGKWWMDVVIVSSLGRAQQELGRTAIFRPSVRHMERKEYRGLRLFERPLECNSQERNPSFAWVRLDAGGRYYALAHARQIVNTR